VRSRRVFAFCALFVVPIRLGALPDVRLPDAAAQAVTYRGFVDARATLYPQDTPTDPVNASGDLLARGELFVTPAAWLQIAVGLDARGNTHDQVELTRRLDFDDRAPRRPLLSIRRLSATVQHRALTLDVGKQFIRWGKADIVTPTDHFAPRDFLNVIDTEFLAVTGVRAAVLRGGDTVEVVVVPRMTPSRTPLFAQRWAAVPPGAEGLRIVDGGALLARGAMAGARWSHIGARFEMSLSYVDGLNHMPNIDTHVPIVPGELVVTRVYPDVVSYGADAAVPTRWFTVKGEWAYFTSSSPDADAYVLYVVQLERLAGEWVLVGGYAGEVVTERRAPLTFAPNRGLTRSVMGRAAYTIDANRSAAVEAAVRQNGDGGYAKVEYTQARGQHWRWTVAGALLAGRATDFLGQYRRNSHVSAALRYSF
jgi:hypothetical protein